MVGSAGLDDIEREAALQFHAGRTKDGTQRARGATLLADDLTNVAGSDVEAKDGGFLFGESFYADGVRIVD